MGKSYEENDDEIQIDLMELLLAFKKRLWLIILAALVGGIGAGLYSKLVLTPTYTSTSTVFVVSKETTLTSLADLQIGSQLTNDYKVVINSRPVLQEVIDNLGLSMNYRQLRGMIAIDNPTDTRILSISVTDVDPVRAKAIVDQVSSTSSQYIGDIMEMIPPKIIEEGEVPTVQTSPSVKKNAMIGAVALAFVVCAVVALRVILNDTIRSDEDVERYLGMSVLAQIPDEKDGQESSEEKRKASRIEKKKK